MGLVNKVVPRADLMAEAGAWAARLAAGPTKAIGAAKYLTNRSLESDRAGALWDEAVLQELVTDDRRLPRGPGRIRRAADARSSGAGSRHVDRSRPLAQVAAHDGAVAAATDSESRSREMLETHP